MDALERVKARIPEAAGGGADALLSAYLADAGAYIRNLTGRAEIPAALMSVQAQLAVMLYNRQGIEGEQARATGGVSRTLYGEEDLPASLRRQVLAWRLAPVARRSGVPARPAAWGEEEPRNVWPDDCEANGGTGVEEATT